MAEAETRRAVADLLRRLPSETDGSVPASSLSGEVAALLELFGVVTIRDQRVKASSPAASLFLRSLAEYAETGTAVLGNWDRGGVGEPPHLNQEVLSGPQFLYLLERQRLHLTPGARPLRHVRVAQVLVKARRRGHGHTYLVIYDREANQYQLPGGHMRASDPSIRDVAVRELEEELPHFAFDSRREQLMELGTATVVQLSRTLGVLTRYEITYFQLLSSRRQLEAGPDAHWVNAPALLDEDARINRVGFNMRGLRDLLATLPQGLEALPLSLVGVQRRTVRDLAREKPWEFYGMVIGVLGIVLSLILFFLE